MSKKKGIAYWKGKAWDEFSKFIRLRDALKTTGTPDSVVCYTCYKQYPAFGRGCVQAGHFIPGRSHSVLFDERGVKGQCYHCNHHLRGNWPEFYKHLKAEYGQKVIDELIANKYKAKKYNIIELQELRNYYKEKYKELYENPELILDI